MATVDDGGGKFHWVTVGNRGSGTLDSTGTNRFSACLESAAAEGDCSLNANPDKDAEDPRVAAGTLTPGGATTPWVSRHSRSRPATSPWMARWLSRSSSFTASGRKSLPDSCCLSRSAFSAASKRSARSLTDGSGNLSARAWMPRIISRMSTSFSRKACGSRAGSFMMARSWPALSRDSDRK